MLIQLLCFVLHVCTGTLTPYESKATFLRRSVRHFSNLDVAVACNRMSEMTSLSRVVTYYSLINEFLVNVAPNTVLRVSKYGRTP
jgi:hypothetical protein